MSRVEELEKQIQELQKELKFEKMADEVECQFEDREIYWFLNPAGETYTQFWDNTAYEREAFSQGNIFKTKHEVRKERDRRALLTRFRQFRDKCNGEWEPGTYDCKYFISYDGSKKVLESGWNDVWDNFNTFGYFYDERDCLHAIDLFGDEIKRLWVECE